MKEWQEIESRLGSNIFETQRGTRRLRVAIYKIKFVDDIEKERVIAGRSRSVCFFIKLSFGSDEVRDSTKGMRTPAARFDQNHSIC